MLGVGGLYTAGGHPGNAESEGILEIADIKAGHFLHPLQPVHQCVAVEVELSGCLGNIQAVFEKAVDGGQKLIVKNRELLAENVPGKGFAQGEGELTDQLSESKGLVGDDLTFREKELSCFHGEGSFMVNPGKLRQ